MSVKLLIAEDEDMIRLGIEKYIRLHTDRFDKIYLAANGQETLDIIFKQRPDVMLLDVQMPIKNGIEVMQEAKNASILPATIILSGYDDFKYAQQAIKFGAKSYMLKPSRSSDILKCLHDVTNEAVGIESDEENLLCMSLGHVVNRAREYVEEHYFEELSLQQVAEEVGISAGYLSTLFAKQLQIGYIDYLNKIRIEHACDYLLQGYFKTYEIAYKVGFRDEKYFSKVFKRNIGMTPSEFKSGKNL